jgi:hypothetical protein
VHCAERSAKRGKAKSRRICSKVHGQPARRTIPIVIKGLMRKITLALLVATLPTWGAAQQTSPQLKHLKKTPKAHSAIRNPCAQYGPGFIQVAGSDTCLKIGGSVGAESSGSRR